MSAKQRNELSGPDVTIAFLADHPHLIPAIGEMRWREWGHPPEPDSLAWWVEVTARESGRDTLPVTWVAIDGQGRALGAVALDAFDIEERRDRSPWAVGVLVAPEYRNRGIGSQLMNVLEQWARCHGYRQLWVATGGRAVRFYQKCGWVLAELIERPSGEVVSVLTRSL